MVVFTFAPVGLEDDSSSAGAPAKEIEITPEMIEAGADVLLNDSFLDLSRSIAGHLAEEVLRRGLASRSADASDGMPPDYYRHVFIPAEVLAVAEYIAGDSDVLGLEQDRLEWLLRAVLYIDRRLRPK